MHQVFGHCHIIYVDIYFIIYFNINKIDGGVLSELPIELRDEITTHFQDRKKVINLFPS